MARTHPLIARPRVGRWPVVIALTWVVVGAGACASTVRNQVPAGTSEADRFLFERGTEALDDERWLVAREYFRQLTDTYTQSPYRPDAKLGLGDTYLGEGTPQAIVLGINEFQEFLAFYPTHARADYAQYQLGMAYFQQMRSPQRDQTETRSAVREFEGFISRYPNSSLLPEVREKLREARDRLSLSEMEVGIFYYRQEWYPGALDRLTSVLREDPEFTHRDAVYFFLAESLARVGRPKDALPYLERLIAEYQVSEYLDDARERLVRLKALVEGSPSDQ